MGDVLAAEGERRRAGGGVEEPRADPAYAGNGGARNASDAISGRRADRTAVAR